MKLLTPLAIFLHLSLITAFSLFRTLPISKGSIRSEVSPDIDPNPHEVLVSRKPEIYIKAMLELKRLEEEPICHRVAVQLLMNNCQGLENIGAESNYQFESAHIQRHHVESFSASLAICDLERGSFTIPPACIPFTSPFLLRASRDGYGQFQVSSEQVGTCLGALGQDHSHWMTWLSYRDKALLFCRAARYDIDKDQAILHYKKLTQIMAEFTKGLEDDLDNLRMKMVTYSHTTESYFEGIKYHVENLKVKFQDSMEFLSQDFKVAATNVKSSISSTVDLQRMLKNLLEIVIKSNAEVAAGQEQALIVTANQAKSQMEGLSIIAGETGESLAELKRAILMLFPAIVSLGERQDDLDRRSEILYSVMKDVTNLMQNHSESLEQASFIASGIHDSLEQAAASAKLWNDTLILGGSVGDYAIRFAGPLASVFLGNYGLHPSLSRNAILIIGGYGFAETIVRWRHWGCNWAGWSSSFLAVSKTATSMTQLPQDKLATDLDLPYEECSEDGFDMPVYSCGHSSL